MAIRDKTLWARNFVRGDCLPSTWLDHDILGVLRFAMIEERSTTFRICQVLDVIALFACIADILDLGREVALQQRCEES